jgi:hypothetical protein
MWHVINKGRFVVSFLLLTLAYGACCSDGVASTTSDEGIHHANGRFYPGYQLTTGPDPRCPYNNLDTIEHISMGVATDLIPVPEPFYPEFLSSSGSVLELTWQTLVDTSSPFSFKAWIMIPEVSTDEPLPSVLQTSGYFFRISKYSGSNLFVQLRSVDVRLLEVSEQQLVASIFFGLAGSSLHYVGTFEIDTLSDGLLCQGASDE